LCRHYEQQLAVPPEPRRPAWTGGHGTEPYEQNTQQSPGFGRSMEQQPVQRQKNWQASVSIVSARAVRQCGQVMTD
jgi:hypothetical protein